MTKDIIRFYRIGGRRMRIHACVTQEQAQEWCSSELTSTANYFDGFTPVDQYNLTPKYASYFAPTKEYH